MDAFRGRTWICKESKKRVILSQKLDCVPTQRPNRSSDFLVPRGQYDTYEGTEMILKAGQGPNGKASVLK